MNVFAKIIRKIDHVFHPSVGEIWMLHRVAEEQSEKADLAALEVTPQHLESLIAAYRDNGYTFVSLDDIFAEIQTAGLRKCKKICMTFDDGYRDNYELAYPLLKRLNVPFAIYVSMDFVDDRNEMWWYPGQKLGIAGEQLLELASEPLCTLGAHTMSHPKLDTLDEAEQEREIAMSKTALERFIGKEVRHFSYPYGAHNQVSIGCVKRAGFVSAVQSWGGTSRRGDNCWELKRNQIDNETKNTNNTKICINHILYHLSRLQTVV